MPYDCNHLYVIESEIWNLTGYDLRGWLVTRRAQLNINTYLQACHPKRVDIGSECLLP